MDKINAIVGLNLEGRSTQFIRENGRSHTYRNLNSTQWWRLIRAINYAMNDNYRAVITTDGWVIYRK